MNVLEGQKIISVEREAQFFLMFVPVLSIQTSTKKKEQNGEHVQNATDDYWETKLRVYFHRFTSMTLGEKWQKPASFLFSLLDTDFPPFFFSTTASQQNRFDSF